MSDESDKSDMSDKKTLCTLFLSHRGLVPEPHIFLRIPVTNRRRTKNLRETIHCISAVPFRTNTDGVKHTAALFAVSQLDAFVQQS